MSEALHNAYTLYTVDNQIDVLLLPCTGRMGIFSGNTVEWMLAMQAGNYYSIYTGERHWTGRCSCGFTALFIGCPFPLQSWGCSALDNHTLPSNTST